MSDDETKTYNIHIVTNDAKKRKIEESDKPTETYILIQNQELSNQNKQLIIDMKALETEKDEIDGWLDKSDKDKNHMKNFIKTILQLNNLNTSIKDNLIKILQYKTTTNYIFVFCILFNFFLIFIEVPYFVINICWFSYFFIGPIFNNYEEKFYKNNIKYQTEYNDIEKNNSFLNDYIDNM
jgi:hypothetical protein